MGFYDIRVIGDPVLTQRASEIQEVDSALARLSEAMTQTMYRASGIGLAAPQVGVRKRLFVWDSGRGPRAIANPEIVESDGEWAFRESCLSIPDLSWEVVRPKRVHMIGRGLDGGEVSVEADEMEARLFQHELDHLDGILLIERLDDDSRQAALRALRRNNIGAAGAPAQQGLGSGGLRLP